MRPGQYPNRGKPRYPTPGEPHVLAALDPGKRKLGFAWGVTKGESFELIRAATLHGEPSDLVNDLADLIELLGMEPERPVCLVAERPIILPTDNAARKRDVQPLIDQVDALAARGLVQETYIPAQWKGTLGKDVVMRRIRRALRPSERAVMPATTQHDAWDAAGIWLYATGRVQRGIVP